MSHAHEVLQFLFPNGNSDSPHPTSLELTIWWHVLEIVCLVIVIEIGAQGSEMDGSSRKVVDHLDEGYEEIFRNFFCHVPQDCE